MPAAVRLRHVAARLACAALGATLVALGVASCSGEFTAPPANKLPVATMSAPAEGATFSAGDTIAYAGTGMDAEDGDIRASHVAWWVEVVRGDTVRTLLPRTAGARRGSIVVPMRGDLGPEMRYRFHLEVRDGRGGADTVVRDVAPRTSTMRFETVPAGLRVVVDGDTAASPREIVGVVRSEHDVEVASPQSLGASQYVFSGWSDGTARAHTLATPATGTTWVATFALVPPPNQPPSVSLAAPVAGARLVAGLPIVLRANAADADGRVARVEFLVAGAVTGTATGAPFEVTWMPVAPGEVSIQARAIDDSGAVTLSAPVTVTIVPAPNVPPAVTVTAPANGTRVAVGTTLTLRASASDIDGRVAQVTFHDGAALLGTDTSAPYELAWTATGPGEHAITARALDDSGTTTVSPPITVVVLPPPNMAPTVTLVSPAAGSAVTLGTTVTVRADAADADGRVVRVELLVDGAAAGAATAAPWEVAWTPGALGPATLVARATDDSGAVTVSAPVAVTVVAAPNVAPVVALTVPVTASTYTLGATVALRATASDADGAIVRVEFLDGATVIGSDDAAPYALDWVPTTTGARVVTARAVDDDGATTTAAGVTVTIVAPPPPNVPPTVALTAPVGGSTVTIGVPLVLSASAADADGRVARVEFLAGGTLLGEASVAPFEIGWTPTTLGTVVLVARATDDSGAVVTSVPVTVNVVPAPNILPVVAITLPAPGSSFTLGAAVTLRASATDADGQVVRVTFHDGTALLGSASAAPFEITWTPATAGVHVITARATDDAGAIVASAPVSVTIVPRPNTPPSVSITAPVAGSTIVLGSAVTLSAAASDADGTVRRVEFLADGIVVGSDDAAPFAISWTPTALGTVSLTARAIDDSAAVTTSTPVPVEVVRAPNVPPTVAVVAPASGSSFTLGTTITLRATTADADGVVTRVAFLDGTVAIGTATAAPWEVAWTPTTSGVHTITAQATDDAGAITSSAAVTVSIMPVPNVAPSVTLTAPASGTTIALGSTTTLSAAATDADGAVARVDFLANGTVVGSDVAAPFAVAWTPSGAGPVSLVARATDDSGAVTLSLPVAVTVVAPPNQPPSVALSSPVDGSTVTIGVPVTLRATASDADGRVTRVEFLAGGTVLGAATASPFELAWTPAALGSVALSARAADDSGAVVTSAVVTVNVVAAPNVPPTVALTLPAVGSTFMLGATVTVGATAADADGRIVRVTFHDGATLLGTTTSEPYEIAWTPAATGSHTLTAQATDDAGAITTSAPIGVTVAAPPNRPPTVAITAPTPGATVTAGLATTLRATAADADGRVIEVAWFANGSLVGAASAAPFELTWTPTSAGSVTLVARATDDSSAVVSSAPVTVTVVPPPNVAPTVALTAPAAGSAFVVGSSVTLRAAAADADGRVVSVTFRDGTTLVGIDTSAPFEVTWTATTLGAHSLTAEATDDAGATTTSAVVGVTILGLPNVPPTVAIAAPANGSSVTVGTTVTLRADASDADGRVTQVEFLANGTVVGASGASPFTAAWAPSALGQVTLVARARDDSGSVTLSAPVVITVVAPPNVPPTVSIAAPAAGSSFIVGTSITVRAIAADADGSVTQVTFRDGATLLGTDASAPFEIVWTPTSTGMHTLTAEATDDAGAIATSVGVGVTVLPRPNVAPTVSLVAPVPGSSFTVGTTVMLRADASDADGRVVRVELLANGSPVGVATSAPWEVAWTPAAVGSVAIVARATDDSGSVTTSVPVTVSIVPVPNVPPVVSITSPASGTTVVVGTSVTLRAAATDADGNVARVTFHDGATLLGTLTSAPWELTWTPASTGSHAITAQATDDAGAITTSAAITVNVVPVPNRAPTVAITAPVAGATFVVGTPVTLAASAADPDGVVRQVEFLADGAAVGTDLAAPFAATWTPATAGTVTLTARATDDSGAVVTSAPVSVTVVPQNRAPVATITAPVAGSTFRAGDVVTYAGSGSDPEEGAIPAARTTWWIDLHHDTHTHPFVPPTTGALGGTVTLPTETETSANIWYRFHLVVTDTGGLADTVTRDILPVTSTMRFTTVPAGLQVTVDGQPRTTPIDIVGVVRTTRHLGVPSPQTLGGTQYVFSSWSDGGAAAHDIATPETNTTYTATFTAVAPANQPPTVSIAAPAAGATLTTGVPVTVRANAADTDGTVAQVTFLVDGVAIGTATASPFQVTWTPSTLGTHQLSARAVDDDGDATTSAAVTVTVQAAGGGDVTAPTIAITAPANNANGLTGAVAVSANASDNVGVAGVTFQLDGETIDVEDTSAPYSVTIPSTAAYTTGQHVIRARARDAAGNLSQWATVTVGFGGSVNLPAGFVRTAYTNGLPAVTTMAFAPDGRLFIAEQGGRLRVVKNGVLLATPFHTFPTSANGERGLLGVAFDPAFATTRWVYAYYTASGPTRNIVVRLRASATNGDVADASDIDTLLTLPNLGPTNHNGGALHFGPDGTLFVAVGDNGTETNAPLLTTPLGKILRINADGTIPTDNPFLAQTTGTNRAIWARGLRNPFTFGFQPGTGRMMINDVGQGAWEEVNEGIAGSNYGWPDTEGYTTNPAFRSPLFAYPHSGGITIGFAVVGAAFYNPPVATFPAAWVGDYFFGDYVEGWVARMDLDNANAVYAFARFPNTLVFDVRTGPDGALYVLSDNVNGSNGVWRIQRGP